MMDTEALIVAIGLAHQAVINDEAWKVLYAEDEKISAETGIPLPPREQMQVMVHDMIEGAMRELMESLQGAQAPGFPTRQLPTGTDDRPDPGLYL
jgi:hypothetical protein